MLRALVKKQLMELFQNYYVDKKTGKAKSKQSLTITVLLAIVLFAFLGFSFYNILGSLAQSIIGHGFNWIYFALLGLASVVLGVFGSVFNTYAGLYLPKDSEFLASLPIPPYKLLISRLIGVYALSLLYSGIMWLPGMIAYWMVAQRTAASILLPILSLFVLALFVTVLTCLLGWVVALIAKRTKGKSFVAVAISLAVMAIYYVVYYKVINSLESVIGNLQAIGTKVKSWLYLFYLLGLGADGSVKHWLLFAGITAVAAALCGLVLAKTFSGLSAANGVSSPKKLKAVGYEARTPAKALLRREFLHFTSVSTWLLNGGFGVLLFPILAVAAVIKSDKLAGLTCNLALQAPDILKALPVIFFALPGFIISTGGITPAAVSMEGKQLWILQTMPIDPWEAIKAKERMAVLLNTAAVVISVPVLGIVLKFTLWQILLQLAVCELYIYFAADAGLALNLRHPNFSWTNVVVPTKQSLPLFISLFGGYAVTAALCFGGFFLTRFMSCEGALGCIAVAISVALFALRRWLKRKGAPGLATM